MVEDFRQVGYLVELDNASVIEEGPDVRGSPIDRDRPEGETVQQFLGEVVRGLLVLHHNGEVVSCQDCPPVTVGDPAATTARADAFNGREASGYLMPEPVTTHEVLAADYLTDEAALFMGEILKFLLDPTPSERDESCFIMSIQKALIVGQEGIKMRQNADH